MPLSDCPDCATPISTEAFVCPKCGRPTGKQVPGVLKWRKILILWVVLVAAFMVIWQLLSSK
jgi:predicted amidophosphoribosyltransferase